MDQSSYASRPPGTVTLEDLECNKLILQPQPSEDPEQSLNWPTKRKAVNYTLVSLYALFTFVCLDIGTITWGPMNAEIGISFTVLNDSFATNRAGLALGCILLVPFAILYGRRPVYMFSTLLQCVGMVWAAVTTTNGDVYGSNILTGIEGAISESIVQMTVVDLFYVHQRARMNAVYLLMVSVGTFLAPVAAGYCSVAQGWRWTNWWTVIFLGVLLVVMIFCYEETKFVPRILSRSVRAVQPEREEAPKDKKDNAEVGSLTKVPSKWTASIEQVDYPKKSVRERLAMWTPTPGESRTPLKLVWDFLTLLQFPAVAYTALMWGATLTWISVMLTTLSLYFVEPPYNFSASSIGLMNLSPFIGSLLATGVNFSNDWIILRLARRNGGAFEPEMRLWLAVVGGLIAPAGLLIFGLAMAQGKPWIVSCIGSCLYGFGFSIVGDTSRTYLQDCYAEVIGNALVSVAFVRNAFATIIVFALTPWISALGLYNMFVCAVCLAWAVYATTIAMLVWGRKWRMQTAKKYWRHVRRYGNLVTVHYSG